MSDSNCFKEAKRLIEFAKICVESYPKNDASFKRMQIEIKNRREFRKKNQSMYLLEKGRYDLVNDRVIKDSVADYPQLVKASAHSDPNSCKIEYEHSKTEFQKRRKPKNRIYSVKKDQKIDKKRQQLLANAEQNSNLLKTLLGNPHINLTLASSPPPPPPPPPPLSQSALLTNTYEPPTQTNYANGQLNQDHQLTNNGLIPEHNHGIFSYQQPPYLVSQDIAPLPGPHMTSTLPKLDESQSTKTIDQTSKSRRKSRKQPKTKQLPKSLRKMGKIAKRYDLNS